MEIKLFKSLKVKVYALAIAYKYSNISIRLFDNECPKMKNTVKNYKQAIHFLTKKKKNIQKCEKLFPFRQSCLTLEE